MTRNIYNLPIEELERYIKDIGEPRYRAIQIWEGLYLHLYNDPNEFSSIPLVLRENLSKEFSFNNLEPIEIKKSSDDQTIKTVFRLHDGYVIEAVLMAYDKRRTLCISTQAGCAMGCSFCATGQMGLKRNLSKGEIVEQVIHHAKILKRKDEKVTNIVYMGMGEPFHNYEETMASIEILNNAKGFNLGARRFTVSTAGLVPGIRKFTKENLQANLAISLHATNDTLRSSMMPVNKRYPVHKLIQACREYIEATRRRVTFEWALIQNVNDSPEQARELAQLLNRLTCHVNIIPLNPTQEYSGKGSDKHRVGRFQKILEEHNIPCTVRVRRGIDIQAGCGQLAQHHS